MDKRTGDIEEVKLLEKLYGDKYRETHTPLSSEEEAVLRPMNRKERRAKLVQMRRAARKAKP